MNRTHSRVAALAALALCALAPAVEAQTLNFAVSTTTSDGKSLTPKLTWSTTPTGATCNASGSSTWTGAKPASGTETLAAITTSASYSLTCTWPGDSTALVSWVLPTTYTDGSPIPAPSNPPAADDLGGFRVVYGTSASNLDQSAYLQDPTKTSWRSPTLAAGTWYFGVKAFLANGIEGPTSNIASKVISGPATQSRTLAVAVRFPGVPTNFSVQ